MVGTPRATIHGKFGLIKTVSQKNSGYVTAIAEKITIEIFKMADLCREKLFFTYCFNLHFSETARDPSLILTMYVLIVMKIIV